MKEILAKCEALSREQLIAAIAATPAGGRCDDAIYRRGLPAAPIFATNMYTAEFLCDMLRKMTGARLDWHYMGGRVIVLLHAADASLLGKVKEAVDLVGICSLNFPEGTFYARAYNIEREEIVRCFKENSAEEEGQE